MEEMKKSKKDSEQSLQDVLTSMPEGVGVTDLDEVLIFINQSFADILGYSMEELVGKNLLELVPPGEVDKVLSGTQTRTTGTSSAYNLEMVRKDGEHRIARVSAVPRRDEHGTIIGTIAVVSDITEQVRSAENLQRSEERHRTLVESMHDIVFVYDGQDTYSEYYAASDHFLYVSPEEFMGKHVSEVLPPDVAEAHLVHSKNVRKSGVPESFDYSLVIDNEPLWFSVTLSLVEGRESVIAVVRDITLRKLAEEDLRRSHRDLELYISFLKHDLRSDLHLLLNYIEVALLNSEDENLQAAEVVIVRMTDLLNLFSEPDDPGEMDLLKIIERVGKLAEKVHSGLKVKIQSHCSGNLRVRGARLLSVVFDNLFRNAAEHSRKPIEVCVTISEQGNMINDHVFLGLNHAD